MPATDYQGSSASFSSFGRSILSVRRDQQVHSMESAHEGTSQELELEAFQKQVAEGFNDLASADSDQLLSIPWVHKLLDIFLSCQEKFKSIVCKNKGFLNKSPADRYVMVYFERSVKGLDVCNAIRDGVELIRQWMKQLEIVYYALDNQRSIGEGQIRRSMKALIDLAIGMLDEKESNSGFAHRNRSFGRNNAYKDHASLGQFRSLSWSVSRNWSAAKHLQAIGQNLVAPKTNEIIATNGLAVAIFTMSYVLYFVMWTLVAAIPCQDRGLQTHFHVTRQFIWAAPVLSLHERILEESRKRERRNACGLLREINKIEQCARHMNELIDTIHFPVSEEKEGEVRQRVQELGLVYYGLKDGLGPLERQVREVFRRIVQSRTEGLDSIGRGVH